MKLNSKKGSVFSNMATATAEAVIASAKGDVTAVQAMVGMEDFSDPQSVKNEEATREQIKAQIQDEYRQRAAENGIVGQEDLTDAQLEAGAIIAMAAAKPKAYVGAERNAKLVGLESYDQESPYVSTGESRGQSDVADMVGMEYYQEQNVDKFMTASFQYNVKAARQSIAAESIFPTITVDPTEGSVLFTLNKNMVHRAVRHAVSEKDRREFKMFNLLDAYTDPSVLDEDAIRIVPYCAPDGSNSDEFINAALRKPVEVEVGDARVYTAPLAAHGGTRNLLDLSAAPGLVTSNYLDESDVISQAISLQAVYIKVNKKGAKEESAQLVRVSTRNLPTSSFNQAPEGDAMQQMLTFRGKFLLDGATTDISGKVVEAADELRSADYTLSYTCNLTNVVNLQTGKEENTPGRVGWGTLRQQDGTVISTNKGEGKAIVDSIVMEIVAYDYDAFRTNSNMRTKGLMSTDIVQRERIKLITGSPVTYRSPTNDVNESAAVQRLLELTHVRNSAKAINKILNHSEDLEQVVKTIDYEATEYEVPMIEGVGRHYVRPWFEKFEFDVNNYISTENNMESDDNLRAMICGIIREQIARAMIQSRMTPAIEYVTNYTKSLPEFTILTDPYIVQWLWKDGDPATLGQYKFRIVSTQNIKFRGRIQWFPRVTDGSEGLNPLNYGAHLWMPPLLTNANLTRNEAVSNEISCQARQNHVVLCPVTGAVIPVGIRELIRSRTPASRVFVNQMVNTGEGETGDIVDGDLVDSDANA